MIKVPNSPRIIPVLLMQNGVLVKTQNFSNPYYVGSPLQALRIFNELEADEIAIIDIGASRKQYPVDLSLLRKLSLESSIPLLYGGGLDSITAPKVISLGYERVLLNQYCWRNKSVISNLADMLGSQAISVGIDFFSCDFLGGIENRKVFRHHELPVLIQEVETLGAGEVFLTDVSREGTRLGLDIEFFNNLALSCSIPIVASGGVKNHEEVRKLSKLANVDLGVGSAFVTLRDKNSVLITYPSESSQRRQSLAKIRALSAEELRHSEVNVSTKLINHSETETWLKGKICKRCLIAESVPGANINDSGVCYYCNLHDSLNSQFPLDQEADQRFRDWILKLKTEGKSKKYDCVIGVSGGVDSSFLLHLLVKHGVKPLAVHFDNTWNSSTASMNIHRLCSALDVDLVTYVVNHLEYDELYRSFIKAGVADLDTPTDIGFATTLYEVAKKFKIKNIVEGHSFRVEGISPLGWLYMDGRYIKSISQSFGKIELNTFPNLNLIKFIYFNVFSNLKRHRPLYFLPYDKESARDLLQKEYNWGWYEGHHLENDFTAFYHSYFLPFSYGIDYRLIELSSLVRSALLSREEAYKRLQEPRTYKLQSYNYLMRRFGYSELEFAKLLEGRNKTYRDFKTYKKTFELLRPFFWLMWKLDRVPYSFYRKYCFSQK